MSSIGKIPYVIEQLLNFGKPQAALYQFRNLDPLIYRFNNDERGEIIKYIEGKIHEQKSDIRHGDFGDIVFDFSKNGFEIINTTRDYNQYLSYMSNKNSTYAKRAMCLLFALLSRYKNYNQSEISISSAARGADYVYAYEKIFRKNCESANIVGKQLDNVFGVAKSIVAEYSDRWTITRDREKFYVRYIENIQV